MNDLFSYTEVKTTSHPKSNVLSVTQISNMLRFTVEKNFSAVAVEGEISSLRIPASGHIYFNLKDDTNVLNIIIWKGVASKIKCKIEEGMQVVINGSLTTYGARSQYQLIATNLEPAGVGALMQQFEELKNKLVKEGLFSESHKKPLPRLPTTIGIITSPTGAVIDDMLHRIAERFPRHVLLWPTLVQGIGAKEQIADAITGFNDINKKGTSVPDVIIIARGGGSLEDLWAFNEEVVVRAVAASKIPVISAIGHEPDTTLCDFAADVRAPTPTAAAEMVVPVKQDIQLNLQGMHHKLYRIITHKLEILQKNLQLLARAIPHPKSQITQDKMWLENTRERLETTMKNYMGELYRKVQYTNKILSPDVINRKLSYYENILAEKKKLLESYSPNAPLKRGYVYVTTSEGKLIRSAKTTEKNIILHFEDGDREAIFDRSHSPTI